MRRGGRGLCNLLSARALTRLEIEPTQMNGLTEQSLRYALSSVFACTLKEQDCSCNIV